MDALNERIKQLRKDKGLTQTQLADLLGVTDKAVSKWEVGEANPDISLLAKLAETFSVSIDYLLTGKVDEGISLDDMDTEKRALFLAKRDDAVNFEKYGYVQSKFLFSAQAQQSLRCPRSYIEIRNAIYECESVKVFNLLASSLLEDIKKRKYDYMVTNYSTTPAILIYDCLDGFVKMCALTNQIELLDAIKFKSFGVSPKDNEQYYRNRLDEFYHIKQETLDFIFEDKRVPNSVVEYVAEYVFYSNNTFKYSYGAINEIDCSNAIRMSGALLKSLYRAKKTKLIDKCVEDIIKEAKESCEKISSRDVDYGWRSSYSFGNYGYLFYHNGNGSMETDSCIGRINNVSALVDIAISSKDKNSALKYSKINAQLLDMASQLKGFKLGPSGFAVPSEEKIDRRINELEREEKYESIMADTNINEKDRRRQLFELGTLKLSETIQSDDYDLFVKFPFEETNQLMISSVASYCKDIRFYIFAANLGQTQDKLDDALAIVLQSQPDRYDILDVLLSAGAQVKDNPAMTTILKQNILILGKQKESKLIDVEVKNDETQSNLLKQLEGGRVEYVIVNLTKQLENRLKPRYGSGMQLLDMIDAAFNDGLVSEMERSMLHNLRKSRNTIMHDGDEKGFFTPEIVKEWIKIVYKL